MFSKLILRGIVIVLPQRRNILVDILSEPLDVPGFRDLIIQIEGSILPIIESLLQDQAMEVALHHQSSLSHDITAGGIGSGTPFVFDYINDLPDKALSRIGIYAS